MAFGNFTGQRGTMPQNQPTVPFQSPSTPAPTGANGIAGAFQGVNPARAGYDVGTAAVMANQQQSQSGQGFMSAWGNQDQAPAQYMRGMMDGLRGQPPVYGGQQNYDPYAGGQSYNPFASYNQQGVQPIGFKNGGVTGDDDDDDAKSKDKKKDKKEAKLKDKGKNKGKNKGATTPATTPATTSPSPFDKFGLTAPRLNAITDAIINVGAPTVAGTPPPAIYEPPADMMFTMDMVNTPYGPMSRSEMYARGMLLPEQPNYFLMSPVAPVPTPLEDTTSPYIDTVGPGFTNSRLVNTPYGYMSPEEATLKGFHPDQVAAANARTAALFAQDARQRAAMEAALPARTREPDVDDDDDSRPVGERRILPVPTVDPASRFDVLKPRTTSSPASTPSTTTPPPASAPPSVASTPSSVSRPTFSGFNFGGPNRTSNVSRPQAGAFGGFNRPGGGFNRPGGGIASLGPAFARFNR
jgi:hypothetical protein